MPPGRPWEYESPEGMQVVPTGAPGAGMAVPGAAAESAPPPQPSARTVPNPRSGPAPIEDQEAILRQGRHEAPEIDPDLALMAEADEALAAEGYEALPSEADQMFEAARAHASRASELRALANQRSAVSAPNPVHAPTMGMAGQFLGSGGLLAEQDEAVQHQHAAQVLEAEALGQQFDERASELRRQAVDQQAAEFERQRQLDEQFQQQQAAMKTYEDAAQKVRQAQVTDPDAWWDNKSTGGKIAAVVALALGAIGGGLAGRPEMGSQIRQQLMQPELEKQKEQYQRLVAGMQTTSDVVGEHANLYAQMMGKFQDERMADLAVRTSILEAVDAEMEAALADRGVEVLDAQQQVELNAIRQEIAKNKMQLEVMAATTPARVSRSAYALPPEARRQLLAEAEKQEKRAEKFEDAEMDVRKAQAIDIPKEQRQQEFQRELQDNRLLDKVVTTHADRVAEFEADITTGKGILELPNLKGQGVGGAIGSFADPRAAAEVEDQIRSLGIDPDDYTTESGLRGAIRSKIRLRQGQVRANARRLSPRAFKRYYGREKPDDPARIDEAIGIDAPPVEVRED